MEFNKFVPKGWGYEHWIVNGSKYCGKLLFFKKGKKCSLHSHRLKEETFYVHNGKVQVSYSDNALIVVEKIILEKGDYFHIPPCRIHQVLALEDTELFEFSTQHFDEDSYRIEKGD